MKDMTVQLLEGLDVRTRRKVLISRSGRNVQHGSGSGEAEKIMLTEGRMTGLEMNELEYPV